MPVSKRSRRSPVRRAMWVLGLSVLVAALTLAGLMFGAARPWRDGGGSAAAPTPARPTRVATPEPELTESPVEEDTPPPSGTTPPRPVQTSPASEPPVPVVGTTAEAVALAEQIGARRGERVAVMVRDRRTGSSYAAGDVDAAYASASVVKVFIATRLLVDGRAGDADIKDPLWRMVTASDDAAAAKLYPLAGGAGLAAWIADRYHLTGLVATSRPGYWGLTRITARAMVGFYTAVAGDPAVGPWLLNAMGEGTRVGADGFNQYFGLMFTSHHWRLKQGWMCCLEDKMRMHSTGYVDHDRYVVVLLTEGPRDKYYEYGRRTLTSMAQALMPGGIIAGSA